MHERLAGLLIQDEDGYHFLYDGKYLAAENPEPVTFILPLYGKSFHSLTLLSLFDDLIPGG